jgi:hypothetical protein
VWLALCDEMRGDRDRGEGEGATGRPSRESGDDELDDAAVRGAARAAAGALCEACGAPAHLLRCRLLSEGCRLLHLQLSHAEAAADTHRARRLARALRGGVCALPRPHLGRATGSEKLLPLLLRWSELLDPIARAAALDGVRHCVLQLPAPEVTWHEA